MVETRGSSTARDEEGWEPDWIEELYSCRLSCAQCGEAVTLAGYTTNRYEQWFDPATREVRHELETHISPRWFLPALPVFDVPEGVPSEVADLLSESFALIWTSPSSAASRLRAALEALMDAQRVRRKRKTRAGKFKPLTLHERLHDFVAKRPEIAEQLMAAKWLGNAGAHTSSLTRSDVLDLMEFVSESLDQLYDERRENLKRRARTVNKRKGR